jgi:hypothetical protein
MEEHEMGCSLIVDTFYRERKRLVRKSKNRRRRKKQNKNMKEGKGIREEENKLKENIMGK